MSNPFPPQPSHSDAIEAALKTLGAVVQARSATYVSSPITSGRRFVQSSPLAESEQASLVRTNLAHSRTVVAKIGKLIDGPVIDPAAMADVEEWDQCDYRQLWVDVIRRYVCKAVFIRDWEFSKGCALEFATCVQEGLLTLDESLDTLRTSDGITMITEAVVAMEKAGYDSTFHRAVLNQMQGALATR